MSRRELDFLEVVQSMGTQSASTSSKIPKAIVSANNEAYEVAYQDALSEYGKQIFVYARTISHHVTPVQRHDDIGVKEEYLVSVVNAYEIYRKS